MGSPTPEAPPVREPSPAPSLSPAEPESAPPPGEPHYPSGDNPYAVEDEDEEEFDTGEASGQEGLNQWMKEAKQKDSDVKEALNAYKTALQSKFAREGFEKGETRSMVQDEMADLDASIAELFLTPSDDRDHTMSDALAMIYKMIDDMAEEEESYDDDDDDMGYDDVDYDDEWKPGMMDAAHHVPLGKLKLEALKKKLVK